MKKILFNAALLAVIYFGTLLLLFAGFNLGEMLAR